MLARHSSKKVQLLGSKEIDTINNSNIYNTYKDLYLSKKEREERLLQGIQSANVLKAQIKKTRLKKRLRKGLEYH